MFTLAGKKNFDKGFVRVRDEYPGKVTITTKIFTKTYPFEYEVKVDSNYKDTVEILEQAGLNKVITSVKFREKWSFDKCHEIVFDLCRKKSDVLHDTPKPKFTRSETGKPF